MSAYFSHPIRGAAGESATPEQIQQACRDCSWMARRIQTEMAIDLYVPADHDEVIQAAFQQGSITERGILLADCEILARRDFVMAYDPSGKMVSRGMRVEIEHALAIGKSVFLFRHWDERAIAQFKHFSLSLQSARYTGQHIDGLYGEPGYEFTACDYRTKEIQ